MGGVAETAEAMLQGSIALYFRRKRWAIDNEPGWQRGFLFRLRRGRGAGQGARGECSLRRLAAPLGTSLAIAIPGVTPQRCEGPRSDATIASDPVAPSHRARYGLRLPQTRCLAHL